MPIYGYRCSCGAEEDFIHTMESAPASHGCSCGKRMTRVIGRCGIRFVQDVNHDIAGWSDNSYDPSTEHPDRDWMLDDDNETILRFPQSRKVQSHAIV